MANKRNNGITQAVLATVLLLLLMMPSTILAQDTLQITSNNVDDLEEMAVISLPDKSAIDMAFSPNGNLLAAVYYSDDDVRIWDVQSGRLTSTFSIDESPEHIAFSPDGSRLAVTTGYRSTDVFIIDAATGEILVTLNTTDSSYDVVFSKDGRWLVVAEFGEFTLWDAQSYEEVLAWGWFSGIVNLAFSSDSSMLAQSFIGSPRSPITLWDVTIEDVKGLISFGFPAVDGATSVALSPDNSHLTSGHCDNIYLWDISTPEIIRALENSEPLATLEGHVDCVSQLAYTPNGSLLISASAWSQEIRLWNIESRSTVKTISGGRFAINSDGTQIATTDGSIHLWAIRD